MNIGVIYHDDLDGECSAAIVHSHYRRHHLTFVRMNYKDSVDMAAAALVDGLPEAEPIHDNFGNVLNITKDVKFDKLYIVDFSFKPEDMRKLLQSITVDKVTWIDHHKTAEDYVKEYEALGIEQCCDFRAKKYGACELVWHQFFSNVVQPRAVQLIGDYDCWRLEDPCSASFHEGLKLYNTAPTTLNAFWQKLFVDAEYVKDVCTRGESIICYRDKYCSKLADTYGYEVDFEGHTVFVMNVAGFGSPMFGDRFKKYPFCISYIDNGSCYTVNMYANCKDNVDVSEIAKRHGGGGHKGAAGFTCGTLPFVPYKR